MRIVVILFYYLLPTRIASYLDEIYQLFCVSIRQFLGQRSPSPVTAYVIVLCQCTPLAVSVCVICLCQRTS